MSEMASRNFCEGILHYGPGWPDQNILASSPILLSDIDCKDKVLDPRFIYQTLLLADGLRHLALQMCATKESGHVGGCSSAAEAYAALYMLGLKNIICDTGHHAPSIYSALFLDGSLDLIGITNVKELCLAFRERGGLAGHPSIKVPGVLTPSGVLGQGQHFAMAAALRFPHTIFPLILGDGGLDEPYILTSLMQFSIAFPDTTNILPIVVWNGYSQEHNSTLSVLTNEEMETLLRVHGLGQVTIVDASSLDVCCQGEAFADTSRFSLSRRLEYQKCILLAIKRAAEKSVDGTRSAVVIKHIKGAGTYERGAKSHNLMPGESLKDGRIQDALKDTALSPSAWFTIRQNLIVAGGGPAATSNVFIGSFIETYEPKQHLLDVESSCGSLISATSAIADAILARACEDSKFLVTNSDGHCAMGMKALNEMLGIRHPTLNLLYDQHAAGRVYSPINEDACAGLAAAYAFWGGRSIWTSYESFAINGIAVLQTAAQALAESEQSRPSIIGILTSTPLEQYRNGWTHQRPEIEAYLQAMVRSGNVFVFYPPDANVARSCYQWAYETNNKCVMVICSRTPLPVRFSNSEALSALMHGAIVVAGAGMDLRPDVVLVAVGDLSLKVAMESHEQLVSNGINSRVVSVVCPRRLYREEDVAWKIPIEADNGFMSDADFSAMFTAKLLVGVCAGASASLEPVLIRTQALHKTVICWQRGNTAASLAELAEECQCGVKTVVERVLSLMLHDDI